MNDLQSKFATVNGLSVYYRTNGIAAERSLVMIHGSGGDNSHWPEEAFFALPELTVLALDLPGHGASQGSGCKTIDQYADFMEAFCSGLGLKNVYTAGHSLGGAIVLTLGLRAPSWLAGLILVGTGGRLRVADAILGGILSDPQGTINVISDYAWGPDATAEQLAAYKTEMALVDPEVTHGDFNACNNFDVMDRLGEIKLPSLIISGIADRLTPEKYGAFLQKGITGSVFETIENGGHMMALEKPARFVEIVKDFLST